jgi:hypothetical protein
VAKVHDWFDVHDGLIGATRVPSISRSAHRMSAMELVLLLACGAAAGAAVAYVKLSLRIPGHSIVLATLPMVLGLSLAPRRLAGTIMSAGAVATGVALLAAGGDYGSGAFVSLSLIGPMMDLAVSRAGNGWRLYAALVLAGVTTNLMALASRASFKLLGLDGGSRPFDGWWVQASVTYTLSGVVAGLLGALCWFRFADRSRRGPQS